MRILRHAQIAITIEAYTEVPDDTTTAVLKQLTDAPTGLPPVEGELR